MYYNDFSLGLVVIVRDRWSIVMSLNPGTGYPSYSFADCKDQKSMNKRLRMAHFQKILQSEDPSCGNVDDYRYQRLYLWPEILYGQSFYCFTILNYDNKVVIRINYRFAIFLLEMYNLFTFYSSADIVQKHVMTTEWSLKSIQIKLPNLVAQSL